MSTIWRLGAFVSIAALALFAALSASAGNPHPTYTCTKVKHNGDTDVQVNVPESAVAGLTNAGFTCVASEDDDAGGPPSDPGSGNQGDQGDQGDQGNQGDQGDQGNQGDQNTDPGKGAAAPSSLESHQESRSLYCLVAGQAAPADWDHMGVALNLFDSQGALLVQMGVATPARFYQEIGASCDVLPGYAYAGVWVDHMGSVVPGVAVYPLYVTG